MVTFLSFLDMIHSPSSNKTSAPICVIAGTRNKFFLINWAHAILCLKSIQLHLIHNSTKGSLFLLRKRQLLYCHQGRSLRAAHTRRNQRSYASKRHCQCTSEYLFLTSCARIQGYTVILLLSNMFCNARVTLFSIEWAVLNKITLFLTWFGPWRSRYPKLSESFVHHVDGFSLWKMQICLSQKTKLL